MKQKTAALLSVVGVVALVSTFIAYAQGVDYATQIQPIFNASCNPGCHDGTNAFVPGLKLTSYEDVIKGSNNGPMIVPGDANGSLLIWKLEGVTESGAAVSGSRMPFGKAPLDAAKIQWIKDWINEGALQEPAPTAVRAASWGQIKSSMR